MLDQRAHDTTAPAPEGLELLQRFLNLHDHLPEHEADVAPSRRMLRSFLVERGLLFPDEPFDDDDRDRALSLHEALHARIRGGLDGAGTSRHVATIDAAAERAGLRPRFGAGPGPSLEPTATGVDGALGRLVALAFLSELDGSWAHLKECASDTCRAVFYDRSKNRSGRWCSMRSCGNRHKVRAWRERQRDRVEGA